MILNYFCILCLIIASFTSTRKVLVQTIYYLVLHSQLHTKVILYNIHPDFCKVKNMVWLANLTKDIPVFGLHDFLANPRSTQVSATLLYSSRKFFKPGFVETLSDIEPRIIINREKNIRIILLFSTAACKNNMNII